jgi:hypothetical protein
MPLAPPYDANWITLAVLCRFDNAHGNDFPDQGQHQKSVVIRGEIGKT